MEEKFGTTVTSTIFITLNERLREEASTRPYILHVFGEGDLFLSGKFREKSENFEKGCDCTVKIVNLEIKQLNGYSTCQNVWII